MEKPALVNRRTVLVSVAATAVSVPRAVSAQSPLTIRLGTVRNESSGLAFYAEDQGFFKQLGVDVQIQAFAAGGQITAAVAGGALDIGCSNVGSLANAHAHGVPVSILAPGGQYSTNSPTTVIVTAKNSDIFDGKDLDGKTIGLSTLGDLQQAAVMSWSAQEGGKPNTLKFVELNVTEMAAALTAGRIQAATLLEPSLTYAKNDVRVLGKCYDAIGTQFLITAHFAMRDWLDKNSGGAKRVISALRMAAHWANTNPAAATTELEKISKIPASTIGQMNRVTYGETLQPDLIQPVIDGLARYKMIKRFRADELIWPQSKNA